jgi:uncharacterized damage-inducible protein DinB
METIVEQSVLAPVLQEFREEAATTRRVLERVPESKLTWKPHAKSMSLGQLAWHVATTPGGIARLVQQESFDVIHGNFVPPQPKNLGEILAAYEQSIRDAEKCLESMPDDRAKGPWRLERNGKEVFTQPRTAVIRTIMLNHWYHHRGQLSVYLRLLEVPVPVIYGRSADEDPFA